MEALPIPSDTYKLGFIGAGKMAENIARGVVQLGLMPPSRISTSHSNPLRRTAFESFGVSILSRIDDVIEECDVVIFSVKPQAGEEMSFELELIEFLFLSKKSRLTSEAITFKKKLLVSIAAGIKMKDLEEWPGQSRFIRVMPNTPSAVGEAASVMSLGGSATEEDADIIAKLFGSVGKIWRGDEKLFDAVTDLSGSSPAYIYLAIQALADGGVTAGLPRELALGLASQTVLGAATMATKTGKHPCQLKDNVTSPGGTTIAGIHELEKGGSRGTLMNVVIAASNCSREVSQN
ncbi:hypothetical protein SO802_032170 [Lithocarpus litseifolius]|uniref:Pyrroline-5-carboxylate reductase n=1 Tax=Lithocarpus litseifolius TaxID=425828 RepID=A0AAW2BMI5_9ROSI